MANSSVLVTGASGLIGRSIVAALTASGYEVNILTTQPPPYKIKLGVHYYHWQPEAGIIDTHALADVHTIIHLAGAGVADQRWTAARKRLLYDSRIASTRLLVDTIAASSSRPTCLISASATGYYGDRAAEVLHEDSTSGGDFLAKLCIDWEHEAMRASALGVRTVCLRTGIVLAPDAGAWPKLIQSARFGIAGYIAQDPLYYPWIHHADVTGIYLHAMRTPAMQGSYNTCAPSADAMRDMLQCYKDVTHSRAVLLPIPPLVFKLAMGELSQILLCSQRVSAHKIMEAGYSYLYPKLADAIADIAKS
jgi:uncharacterized protein